MGKMQLFVSSDVSGMHQDLDTVAQIYSPVAKYIDGMELLALGDTYEINKKIAKAHEFGFKQVSLHGKIGALGDSLLDTIKVIIVESQLIPTKTAISDFGATTEILLHSPEVKKQNKVLSTAHNLKYLWVENDLPQLKALQMAVNEVKELRSKGIKCGLMLDLCHAIGGHHLKKGNFNREWHNLKEYINNILIIEEINGEKIWQGIHLPIGTLRHDSLPIDHHIHLSGFMLGDIADWVRKAGIQRVVIENQNGIGLFGISEGMILKQQKRVENIFERLKNHKII
ncbi:hypothetical protein HYT02_05605 [Candidatus Gottesmanbacteria bacterium]|nr:hypothetical protein [Candidatus Gottesmanbacteria bacterium]